MERLERTVRKAHEVALMMHEDFPEIKRGLINGRTLSKLTDYFMCQIRYGFYPIYDENKLDKYSQGKKVIQKAIRFMCYGYEDCEQGNYGLRDFEGTLLEEEEIGIRQRRVNSAKESKIGIFGLSSDQLREQARGSLNKTILDRPNLLTERQKKTFFKLWADKRYQHKNGNPNFVKIGIKMKRKPEILRSFHTRFKIQSGIETKKYIDWDEEVTPINQNNSIPLIDFVDHLVQSGDFTTVRHGKRTPAYRSLTGEIHNNLPEYENRINPDNLRRICNIRNINVQN